MLILKKKTFKKKQNNFKVSKKPKSLILRGMLTDFIRNPNITS